MLSRSSHLSGIENLNGLAYASPAEKGAPRSHAAERDLGGYRED
jgi:hypothetical protein